MKHSTPPRILVISDAHCPHNHPQALEFLIAVKKKYKCNVFKSVGDIVDNASTSYHEKEYGLLSPKDELDATRKELQKWEKHFPHMTICSSNHGDLPLRKAKTAGIPLEMIKDYNQLYGLKTWKWVDREMFPIGYKQWCLLVHSVSSNARNNSIRFSHCSVQGHHHSEFGVHYYADSNNLRWHMSVGCLINSKSPAFNYQKTSVFKKPILGCGVIIDAVPQLVPMRLDKNGNWIGSV